MKHFLVYQELHRKTFLMLINAMRELFYIKEEIISTEKKSNSKYGEA